jgi:hypothetical protein
MHPKQDALKEMMQNAGLERCEYFNMSYIERKAASLSVTLRKPKAIQTQSKVLSSKGRHSALTF